MAVHSAVDVSAWRRILGLAPVPLRANARQQFVLFNGRRGNYCLDFTGAPLDVSSARSAAWSADVGHYVQYRSDGQFTIQRWDHSAPQRWSVLDLEGDLPQFQAKLERDQPDERNSIVTHATSTFRQLRNNIPGRCPPREAVGAFLCLLAASEHDTPAAELCAADVGLSDSSLSVARDIPLNTWHDLVEQLRCGPEHLRADVELILRHAAGRVFQEAHYEAAAVMQLSLFGGTEATLSEPADLEGVHFTPQAIARTIVEEALAVANTRDNQLTILDPACGSGEFLKEALRQLWSQSFPGSVTLVGFDISPAAVEMAGFSLRLEAAAWGDRVTIALRELDALNTSWPEVDVLLMNPPFRDWRDLAPDERRRVRADLGELGSGRPDYAAPFLLRAVHCIRRGGALGAVLPASILDGESARMLREHIAHSLTPTMTARLGSHHLFMGAAIDAGLLVGRIGTAAQKTACVWAGHELADTSGALRALRRLRASQDAQPIAAAGHSVYLRSATPSSESWAPRPFRSQEALARMAGSPKVGDLFSVTQGVLTGLNAAFIVPASFLDDCEQTERALFRPAVFRNAIERGHLKENFSVFYPYDRNGPTITSVSALRRSAPHAYETLLRPRQADLAARAGFGDTWWLLTRARYSWQATAEPRIVTKYFGVAGDFALDRDGEFIVVQGYAWRTRKDRREQLRGDVGLAYLALLTSEHISTLLSGVSNHTGGGQWNLSKRFITRMPLPDLFGPAVRSDVRALAQFGEAIRADEGIDERDLNRLAGDILGLNT